MRIRLAVPALLVIVLAACGSGASSSGAPSSANPSTPAGQQVDCATIETAAQELLAVQFLAQLRTPDTVEQIRDQQIGSLDLDAFLAAMDVLHQLDSHASPLGDPKAAIDFYEEAARGAQTLFATDPMTQAAIDSYNTEFVGTVPDFLGHQVAIAGALDEAGC